MRKKRICFLCYFLSVLFVLYLPVSAKSESGEVLGGINDQTGVVLPEDEVVNTGNMILRRNDTRDIYGTEYRLVSMTADYVSDLLTSYNKLSDAEKSFMKSDISDDGYVYYTFRLTNTDHYTVKAGICYYSYMSGLFVAEDYTYADSDSAVMSNYLAKDEFAFNKTYYGFIKNEYEGIISGWLHIYYIDPA